MKFRLFVPTLLLAACVPLLTLSGCDSANTDNSVTDNSVAISTPIGTETGTPAPPQLSFVETIFVPDENDVLKPQAVSRQGIDSQLKSGDLAPGLQEILVAAPQYFPPGAKINSAKVEEKHVVVDLNAAFATPDFWTKNGEKTTELAVYAIVNSASQDKKPVLLTVEKKPLQTLGEFDASDPIPPRSE